MSNRKKYKDSKLKSVTLRDKDKDLMFDDVDSVSGEVVKNAETFETAKSITPPEEVQVISTLSKSVSLRYNGETIMLPPWGKIKLLKHLLGGVPAGVTLLSIKK